MGLYHIKTTGTKTSGVSSPGNWSDANCYGTPATVGALNPTGGPHLVLIAPGEYSSYMHFFDASWASSIVFGLSLDGIRNNPSPENYTTFIAEKDEVSLTSPNNTHVIVNCNDFTLKNISSKGITVSGKRCFQIGAGAFPSNFYGENLHSTDNSGSNSFLFSGATNFTLISSSLRGNGAAGCYVLDLTLTTQGRIYHFIATPSETNPTATGGGSAIVRNGGSGVVDIIGSTLIGGDDVSVLQSGTGVTSLKNCIVGTWGASSYPIQRVSGTLDETNTIVIPSYSAKRTITGTITDGGGNKVGSPAFKRNARQAYIIPFVDDDVALGYAEQLETLLATRGVKGSYCIQGKAISANAESLQRMHDRGVMSIHAHSWSHSRMDATGNTFDIIKPTGSTIGSVQVNRSNGTIVLTDDGGIHTIYNFRIKTFEAIRSEIVSFSYNGNSWSVGAVASYFSTSALGESFSETVVSNNIQLLIDTTNVGDAMTGYYYVEARKPLVELESNIVGYTAKGFVCPGGYSSASAEVGLKNAGYAAVRPLGGSYLASEHKLAAINLYRVYGQMLNTLVLGSTDAETIANTRAVCDYLSQVGGVFSLLSHNTTEGAFNQWEVVLDTIVTKYPEIKIISFDELVDLIQADPWSTVDNITYTRSWVDQSDFHLRTDSPCIGTGTKISGISTDIEGNPLFPPYNIGPFGLAEGALGVAPVANDGPPRNNITRLTGTSATIDPAGTYELEDTNAWRVVTGWTAGTANDFFDENGVPIPFTGQQLIDAGIGYQLYYGQKGIAGYSIEQDAKSHKKIVKVLRVNTYLDSILYDPDQDYNW